MQRTLSHEAHARPSHRYAPLYGRALSARAGWRAWGAGAALFGITFATSFVGPYLFTAPAIVFPASGIAVALLYLWGKRLWPLVLAGFIAFHLIQGSALSSALILPIAQTAQAFLGAYLLELFRTDPLLSRLRDGFAVIGVSAGVSTVVPIVWFVGRAFASGYVDVPPTAVNWASLWVGMAFSLLTMLPLTLRWLGKPRFERPPRIVAEIAGVFAVYLACTWLLWWTPYSSFFGISLLYITLIPLFYIALRFDTRFMTLALFFFAAIGIGGALFGFTSELPRLGARLYQYEIMLCIIDVIFLVLASVQEERLQAIRALQAHVETLESTLILTQEQDTTKSKFIAILAHELRNPLAPVVSFLELLRLRGLVAQEGEEMLDLIDERIRVVRRLLDELLDISRINEDRLELSKEQVDIRTVLKRSVASTRQLFRRAKQRLEVALPSEPVVVHADAVRIEQAVTNLLSNASKYTAADGSISLILTTAPGQVEIRVSDTGAGIARGRLQTIFEPFHKTTEEGPRSEGLGLGLSLAKEFVELHGGTIRVRSEGAGRGSTFTILLPRTLYREPSAREAVAEADDAPAPARATRRLLVVDDNIPAAESMVQLLSLSGFNARSAHAGREAIEKTLLWKPHAVLLDIGLPDMDGYEVARQLIERGYGGVLVALTGYGQADDKRRADEAGFHAHLVKPVGVADIRSAIGGAMKDDTSASRTG